MWEVVLKPLLVTITSFWKGLCDQFNQRGFLLPEIRLWKIQYIDSLNSPTIIFSRLHRFKTEIRSVSRIHLRDLKVSHLLKKRTKWDRSSVLWCFGAKPYPILSFSDEHRDRNLYWKIDHLVFLLTQYSQWCDNTVVF